MDPTKVENGINIARQSGIPDEVINSFLKKKGVFTPTLNKFEPYEKPQGFLEKTLSGVSKLVGSEGIGKRIVGEFQDTSAFDNAAQQIQQTIPKLDEMIARGKSLGKDTSNLEKVKNEALFNLQQSQYQGEQIGTGGVSNRQFLGSAIQTASFALPATKIAGATLSKVPYLAKAGNALTAIDKAGKVGGAVAEGVLSGLPYGFGMGLEKGQTVSDAVGTGVATGIAGGVLGPVVYGALKLTGAGMHKFLLNAEKEGLTKEIGTLQKGYSDVLESVNNAFGVKGNKSTSVLINELRGKPGAIQESPRVKFVESLYNRTDDIGDVMTFDPKFKTLTTKKFDPLNTNFLEISDASRIAKQKIWGDIKKVLGQADSGRFETAKKKIVDQLIPLFDSPRYAESVSAGQLNEIINAIRKAPDPEWLDGYMSQVLQRKTKAFFSQADTAASIVAQDAKVRVEKGLDDYLESLGKEFSVLRNFKDEYAAYKALDKEINAKAKELLPTGILDPDVYGLSNVVSGLFFGNPAQTGKGAAFVGLKHLQKFLNADVKSLNAAFKKMDEIFKSTGVPRGSQKFSPELAEFQKGLSETRERISQPTLGAPAEGSPRTSLYSGPTIPVAPASKAGIELTSPQGVGKYSPLPPEAEQAISNLPPEQQEKGRDLIQQTLDLFGQKKNELGGAAAFAPIGTILGLTKKVSESETPQETAKTPETPVVTPAKLPPVETIKAEILKRESKGDYKTVGYTGDLGKYQVKPQTLKDYADDFLGRKVTPKEFLNSSKLQEMFIEGFIKHMEGKLAREPRLADLNVLLAIWHRGFSDLTKERLDKLLDEDLTKKYLNV